jgi:hypothetical protein
MVHHPEEAPFPVGARLQTAQSSEEAHPSFRPCVVEVEEKRSAEQLI